MAVVTNELRTITFSADDFGLSESINEAVENAHRNGVLQAASLMIAGPAAADAVRRARANPSLKVGLHLVVIEGPAASPPPLIPDLVDAAGQFSSAQFTLGVKYFFLPSVRRQLKIEIDAQFKAFAATGLTLDHANAHKHMHLHPTIGAMMIDIGSAYGLKRIRVPAEPPAVLVTCGGKVGMAQRIMYQWTKILRRQARSRGIATNDHCFGLAWSGHMTLARVMLLLKHLPAGDTEIYLHPAVRKDALLMRLMPDYEHEAEFLTLLDPGLSA